MLLKILHVLYSMLLFRWAIFLHSMDLSKTALFQVSMKDIHGQPREGMSGPGYCSLDGLTIVLTYGYCSLEGLTIDLTVQDSPEYC